MRTRALRPLHRVPTSLGAEYVQQLHAACSQAASDRDGEALYGKLQAGK